MPKSSENLWKFWEELGNFVSFRKLRKRFKPVFEELKRFMKLLENFGNSSKVFSRCFYDFLKFSENLRKFPDVIKNVRNGSHELKSFGADF